MSPTVCHDTEALSESTGMCSDSNNVMDKSDHKDRGMEQQCVKRKSSSDETRANKKMKRKETESDTIISSLSSELSTNSDDYGTDTELVAINHNKKKFKNSYRYAQLSKFQDFVEDTRTHLIAVSETDENLMCENNYTISIDERSILSSTTHADEVVKKIITTTKITNANTKHLFDIAISTFKLVKINQEFQVKLKELQTDTRNFLNSIMENPENQSIKEQLKMLM